MKLVLITLLGLTARASTPPTLILYSGLVTKVRCEGKLLISAIGEPNLVALDALPANVGCGVLLKPLAKQGRTNLILETSTGTIATLVEIVSANGRIDQNALDRKLRTSE